MKLLNRLVSRLADRLHPDADLTAALAGLWVTYTSDGRRIVQHPDMPAIAVAYRARVLADPDALDRLFIDRAVLAQAAREARELTVQKGANR